MLYGNMEQLAKLSMSIFALLAWINCSREFILKNIKMPQIFLSILNAFKNVNELKRNAPLALPHYL